MKKIMKKVMCLLLASFMLISLLSIKANCAETYTEEEELAINKLESIGVMIGTDNGFEGNSNLTRAQAATIMVRLKGISETDVENERKRGVTKFKDVKTSHWALGYINLANAYGIVKGVSDTEFDPERKVKVSELVTMAVRVLNAGNKVEDDTTKIWPDNYMDFAKSEGLLTNNESAKANDDATRMQTAFVVTETLEADTWKVSGVTILNGKSKNTYSKSEGDTILKNTFKITRYIDEKVSSVSTSSKEVKYTTNDDGVKSSVPDATIDTAHVNLSKIKKGDNVEVWYNSSSKKIVMIGKAVKGKNSAKKEYNFSFVTKYTSSSNEVRFNIDGEVKTYNFSALSDDTTLGLYNGKAKTKKEFDKIFSDAKSEGKLGELTGKITVKGTQLTNIAMGTYDNVGIVSSVSSKKVTFMDKDDVTGQTVDSRISLSGSTPVCNIDGYLLDTDAIKEGYVLKYFYDEDDKEYHVMTYNKNVTGYVDSRSSSQITIDGEEYKVNFIGSYTRPGADKEIKAYLNASKEIIMYTLDSDIIDISEARENKPSDSDDDDEDEEDDEDFTETIKDLEHGIVTRAEVTTDSDGKKVLKMYITDSDYRARNKYVDEEATLKLFEDKNIDEDDLRDYVIEEIVGTYVQYKVVDNKYVLYQFGKYKSSEVKNRIATVSSAKLTTSSKKLGSYYYDRRTYFYNFYGLTEQTKKSLGSFGEIDVTDLSNSSSYSVSLYFEDGKNTDEGSVTEVLVITSKSILEEKKAAEEEAKKKAEEEAKKKAEEDKIQDTYGLISAIRNNAQNNENKDIDLITIKGKKTYTVKSNESYISDLQIGKYLDYTVMSGDVIDRASLLNPEVKENYTASDNDLYILKCKYVTLYTGNKLEVKLIDNSNEYIYQDDKMYFVKASGLKVESDKLGVSSLATTTTLPAKVAESKNYADEGADMYAYIKGGKILFIVY